MNIPRLRFKDFRDEWHKFKISDLLNYEQPTKYIVKNEEYSNSGTPVLTANKSFVLGYTNEQGLYDKGACIIFDDFTEDFKYVDFPFMVKSSAIKILTSKNKSNIGFMFNLFSSIHFINEGHSRHYISNVQNKQVFTPKLKEQQKISSFFNYLDKQIGLQSNKLEALKHTKKGYLQKMFPSDGSNNPKLRFKGFNNDWKKEKIGNIINVSSSKRVHMNEWTNKGIPFWRARDLVSYEKGYEISDSIYINEKTYEEYSKISGVPKENDLLVTGVGTIGFSYLVNSSKPFYFKDGNIIWFHNDNKFNGSFLKYTFNAAYIQNQIKGFAGVGTVATYTIQSGKETIIKYPEHKEQTLIGMFFNNLDKQIELQQNKLTYLKNQKNAYLQKMFV